MLRDYTLTIDSGSTLSLTIVGDFIRVLDAVQPLRIAAEDRDGREVFNAAMLAGQKVRVPQFAQIRITNEGSSSDTVTVVVGSGDFRDDRISGVLTVQDNDAEQSRQQRAFQLGPWVGAGGAGLYTYAQLWNPVGSGKLVIVNKVSVGNTSLGATAPGPHEFSLRLGYGSALATFQNYGQCTYAGGAVSVAEYRKDNNASAGLGSGAGGYVVPQDETLMVRLENPVVLTPGTDVMVRHHTANEPMRIGFFWTEEDA